MLVIELRGVNAELRAANSELGGVIAAQAARIVELERRLGADSSTSSKPPSSDSPYRKPTRRSERGASGGVSRANSPQGRAPRWGWWTIPTRPSAAI